MSEDEVKDGEAIFKELEAEEAVSATLERLLHNCGSP
jgi:hypothetical protein